MVEADVRQWFKEIGEVVIKGTTITDNAIDDKVVTMFFSALDNDFVWQYLWPIIDGMFVDDTKVQASPEFNAAAETAAIDPLTIIAIVQALISLWKQFRK